MQDRRYGKPPTLPNFERDLMWAVGSYALKAETHDIFKFRAEFLRYYLTDVEKQTEALFGLQSLPYPGPNPEGGERSE